MINLRLAYKGAILVAVPLLLELCILSVLTSMLIRTENEVNASTRSQAILSQTNKLARTFLEASLAMSAFNASKKISFRDQYAKLTGEIPGNLQQLKSLVGQQADEQPQMAKVDQDINAGLALLAKMNLSIGEQNSNDFSIRHQFADLQNISDKLTEDLSALVKGEQQIANDSPEVEQRSRQEIKTWIVLGLIGSLLASLALAYFFSTGISRRVKIIAENSDRLAQNNELKAPIGGADEIADLDKVFHSMAASLHAASEKERALVENAADIICSIKEDGTFERVNAASLAIVGYAPQDLIGKPFQMLVEEDRRDSMTQLIEKCMNSKTRSVQETQLRRRDGTELDVVWSALWSSENQSLFCVIHDITERKKLERLKDEIVQMVAHDLRSPLASLRSFLQLLEQGAYGNLTEQGHKRASTADRSIHQLIRLLNDLLSLDQLKEAKAEFILGDHLISPIVDRSIELVRTLGESRNITIELGASDEMAICDPDRVIQVLANLLSNSVKFSPDGGKITVAIRSTADDTVEISVKDQGPGIPASEHDSIFDRFKQTQSGKKTAGGIGLGLAIAKTIVEQHSGTIGVISEEGNGSTFWFRLPKAKVQQTA